MGINLLLPLLFGLLFVGLGSNYIARACPNSRSNQCAFRIPSNGLTDACTDGAANKSICLGITFATRKSQQPNGKYD